MSTVPSSTTIPAGTWGVDPAHSNVGFAVKHMGLATVRGVFTEFDGLIEIGEDMSTAKAYGTVNVESLDTNQPQRDEHLRSPDFFDTARYPELRFESTGIALDEQTFRITGKLTVHGVTNEIVLHAELHGTDVDPMGQRACRPRGHGRAVAHGLRNEVQPDAGQREHARRRSGQPRARHLRDQTGVTRRPAGRELRRRCARSDSRTTRRRG